MDGEIILVGFLPFLRCFNLPDFEPSSPRWDEWMKWKGFLILSLEMLYAMCDIVLFICDSEARLDCYLSIYRSRSNARQSCSMYVCI